MLVKIDEEKKETFRTKAMTTEAKSRWTLALDMFFKLYKPKRIFATTSTFISIAAKNGPLEMIAADIDLVIFDETSQLPARILTHYAHCLPDARPILIGDRRQLPPFSPNTEDKLITKLISGDTLSHIIRGKLWNFLPLIGVFRNHPWITYLLSDVFYESRLTVAATRDIREVQLRNFWMSKNAVPVAFVDIVNGVQSNRTGGSSLSNSRESSTKKIAAILAHRFGHKNVAILCMYREQAELLRREVSVYWWTPPMGANLRPSYSAPLAPSFPWTPHFSSTDDASKWPCRTPYR